MMTESRAWMYLAECLREILQWGDPGCYAFCVRDRYCAGLCKAIDTLYRRSMTSIYTACDMKCALKTEATRRVKSTNEFIWDSTPIGHQQRREFCLRMA